MHTFSLETHLQDLITVMEIPATSKPRKVQLGLTSLGLRERALAVELTPDEARQVAARLSAAADALG
jgi:hypothetical protein